MKKTIERFNITVEPTQKVKVPFNLEILNFDVLNGEPGFNAIVIDGENSQERTFLITTFSKELPYKLNKTKFVGEFRIKKDEGGDGNVFFVFED